MSDIKPVPTREEWERANITWDDVRMLRNAAYDLRAEWGHGPDLHHEFADRLMAFTDRIAALLPPEPE